MVYYAPSSSTLTISDYSNTSFLEAAPADFIQRYVTSNSELVQKIFFLKEIGIFAVNILIFFPLT